MVSLVVSSAARIQTARVAATLEQRQTLRTQIEAEQARAQTINNQQLTADRTSEAINETRLDRELIRSITDAERIAAARVQETNDLRILERQNRTTDDNIQTLDDDLLRESIRDAFSPLPELQQNQNASRASQTDDSLPVSTDEITLRELLSERDVRLSDRAVNEQSFTQQQTRDFDRSVQAINTFVTQPGDTPSFEERGGIVDFQA